ncbi:MAG: hypothetical protein B7Y12_03555 [Rhizobiales bacterium 24-66-13]|nr:MAG: hypothetical protein B7Y12_03555 [Rhizobiales bacterium 24-66-13]
MEEPPPPPTPPLPPSPKLSPGAAAEPAPPLLVAAAAGEEAPVVESRAIPPWAVPRVTLALPPVPPRAPFPGLASISVVVGEVVVMAMVVEVVVMVLATRGVASGGESVRGVPLRRRPPEDGMPP